MSTHTVKNLLKLISFVNSIKDLVDYSCSLMSSLCFCSLHSALSKRMPFEIQRQNQNSKYFVDSKHFPLLQVTRGSSGQRFVFKIILTKTVKFVIWSVWVCALPSVKSWSMALMTLSDSSSRVCAPHSPSCGWYSSDWSSSSVTVTLSPTSSGSGAGDHQSNNHLSWFFSFTSNSILDITDAFLWYPPTLHTH